MGGKDATGWRLGAVVLAWLAGLALAWQRAEIAAAPWPAAAALAAAAGLLVATWRGGLGVAARPLPYATALAATFVLAGALAQLRAQANDDSTLAVALEGQPLVVIGVVGELPVRSAEGVRFVVDVEAAADAEPQLPARLLLSWSRDAPEASGAFEGPQAELAAGQRWRLPVRLKRPHGYVNPSGFDGELWLAEQRIGATGTVRAGRDAAPMRLGEAPGYAIVRLRQRLRDAIGREVGGDGRAAGIVSALAVGDQGAIERGDWAIFRATGVAHLMAISGLHVTMLAWLAGAAGGALWRRSERLMLAWPAPRAARWLGFTTALGYALLAGWGVPAQRTVVMLGAVVGLGALGLHWPWPLVLGAAAVVVTAVDPMAFLQPGFWLSFAAVGLLLLAPDARPAAEASAAPGAAARLAAALHHGLATQTRATLGLAPLTLVCFQQVSIVGWLANLAAIPLVSFVITPLALLGALLPSAWPAAAWLVEQATAGLAVLAGLPWAAWHAPAAPTWALALGLAAGALVMAPLPWRWRLAAVPAVLPMLLPPLDRPAEGRFELVAADIGQGSAVLVRTQTHLLVYDAGPSWGPGRDAGEQLLVPLLRARGERRIDRLVLTHRDADHVGGAAALLAALPTGDVVSSFAPVPAAGGAPPPRHDCVAGEQWSWDGVRFAWLHPTRERLDRAGTPNARSCVLQVRDADGRSALLTGDIGAGEEAALVAAYGAALRADVLLVPHHGSRSSSSPAFVAAVAPRWAVAQAGYRNHYLHPAPEVVGRYAEAGSEFVRTDHCGAFTWEGGVAPRCEREATRRVWRWKPGG